MTVNKCIHAFEVRKMLSLDETIGWIYSFGSNDCGLETVCQAWLSLDHKFLVQHSSPAEVELGESVMAVYTGPRFPLKILLKLLPISLLSNKGIF